jgi:hypothetical protein
VPKPEERMALVIQMHEDLGILENKGPWLKSIEDIEDTSGITRQRM